MNAESIFEEFHALYKAQNLVEGNNKIIKDGIICEKLFAKQKIKILVIAKEHNLLAKDENDKDFKADYRQWWRQHVRFQFSHRISEWCFGLINGFIIDLKSISYSQKHDALNSIAFINVKKTTGRSSSNKNIILQYINKTNTLLHKQILEIDPNLILCCFRYDFYVEQLFGIKMEKSLPDYSIGKWNDIRIINFYHPSARKSKLDLFEKLKQASNL